MRIVILDDYQGVALEMADWSAITSRADVTVQRRHVSDEGALVELLRDADIIVAMRERTAFPARLLARLPALRLIVTTGPSNAAIDLACAHAAGVLVCGTGGYIEPTVELTWALIFALVRQIPAELAAVRRGEWQTMVGTELYGKTLGIVGLGRIGSAVARVAAALGMRVIAWSANLDPQRARELGVEPVTKQALFATADVVTVHLVQSARSIGTIGKGELSLMKRSAYLVNTARGPIVDEDALVEALREQRIQGAGIDVFSEEPLPADHPMRQLSNVIVTPHIGYVTRDLYQLFHREIVEDIEAFLDGHPLRVVSR